MRTCSCNRLRRVAKQQERADRSSSSEQSINLDTAGRVRELELYPGRIQRPQAGQDETLGKQQSTEATLRGGFHRRKGESSQEGPTEAQGTRGLSHEEPRVTSDSDHVPSARRSTRRTVESGRERRAHLWPRVVLDVNTWDRPTSLLPGWPAVPPW